MTWAITVTCILLLMAFPVGSRNGPCSFPATVTGMVVGSLMANVGGIGIWPGAVLTAIIAFGAFVALLMLGFKLWLHPC